MLTNEQRQTILLLAQLGLLTLPVTVLGETVSAGSVGQPTPSDGYLSSGWKFNAGSPINAPRSRGVDALRADLIAAGHQDIAGILPEYHVVKWWTGASPAPGMYGTVDLKRFEYPVDATLPEGVTSDNVTDALDNVHELWNRQYNLVRVGFDTSRLYRGEAGRTGYSREKFEKGTDSLMNQGRWSVPRAEALAAQVPQDLLMDAVDFERKYKYDVHGTPTGHFEKNAVGELIPGHKVYDVWWDASTDAAITRHWRSFARACGADIGA